MKKDLYLMRHGQTLFNVRRRIQGWCDSPLTESGKQQALKAKEYLKDISFDHYYSSTSERCCDTIELIIGNHYYKRLKGLKERKVVLRYALKNAAPAILTAVGQSFGSLITGTIVTETLFNIPGLGMLTMGSINRRDVYVIQGVVLFVTLLYVLVNLVTDIVYHYLDPRVRLGGDRA